ncbi:MAG: hypothetical protein H7A53_12115 [Akkermansiaceae bacterium]|nr:hypothetical protein [Akkermansiaceae bacterium]
MKALNVLLAGVLIVFPTARAEFPSRVNRQAERLQKLQNAREEWRDAQDQIRSKREGLEKEKEEANRQGDWKGIEQRHDEEGRSGLKAIGKGLEGTAKGKSSAEKKARGAVGIAKAMNHYGSQHTNLVDGLDAQQKAKDLEKRIDSLKEQEKTAETMVDAYDKAIDKEKKAEGNSNRGGFERQGELPSDRPKGNTDNTGFTKDKDMFKRSSDLVREKLQEAGVETGDGPQNKSGGGNEKETGGGSSSSAGENSGVN